ncbi:MAG: FG-GAP-like repeat-containing protein, partial [Actinomycetota bacterium]
AAEGMEGWWAQDNSTAETMGSPLVSEVADGIWRITMPEVRSGEYPTVELVTPYIGRLAEEYEFLRVRWRVTGGGPVYVQAALVPVLRTKAGPEERLVSHKELVLLADTWSEHTFGGLAYMAQTALGDSAELLELHLHVVFADHSRGTPVPYPSTVIPSGLEIDEVLLTGVGEGAQSDSTVHEPSETNLGGAGRILSEAEFCALVPGCGKYQLEFDQNLGSLADTDGDGDLDLVALWQNGTGTGWVIGQNSDGYGRFVPGHMEMVRPVDEHAEAVAGAADLDGDGTAEVVMSAAPGVRTQVWGRQDDTSWEVVADLERVYLIGLGDAYGSGEEQAWLSDLDNDQAVVASLGEGDEVILREVWPVPRPVEGTGPTFMVWNLRGGLSTGVLWFPPRSEQAADRTYGSFRVTYFDEHRDVVQETLNLRTRLDQLSPWIGDVDGDGDVDAVLAQARLDGSYLGTPLHVGLEMAINAGGGEMNRLPWLPQVTTPPVRLTFCDMNGDGMLDGVLPHAGQRERGVVVALGVTGGVPKVEGFYEVSGRTGQCLVGDVDGDGDADVVMLEPSRYGEGGVHVVRNTGAHAGTVVEEEVGGLPPYFGMSPGYPNPFNGTVTVEVRVERAGVAVVGVYDLLGQRVRTLVSGQMVAGVHRLVWDGCRADGGRAASGVYAIRCQMGREQAVTKVVLVQ